MVICIGAIPDAPITASGEELLDLVEEFTYLGILVTKDDAAQKDIKARLGKARGAFARLQFESRSASSTALGRTTDYTSVWSSQFCCMDLSAGEW